MMVEPKATEYQPRHMKEPATEVTLAELRKLAEELPDGVILSMDPWEVVSDGQEEE